MLKKAAYYIMTFILLLSVTGITVNKHYSGNKLFSVSVFLEADSCCENPCDCCTDTSETHSLTDSFVKSDFISDQKTVVKTVSFYVNTFKSYFLTDTKHILSDNFKSLKQIVLNSSAFLQSFRL